MIRIPVAVCGLLLVLTACGGRDTPSPPVPEAGTPTPSASAPQAPRAQPEAASEPADEEGPARGGDEAFTPPPDWCGTPGMWRQPFQEPTGFAIYGNEAGQELRVPLDQLTPEKRAELERDGWTLRMKVSGITWR